MFSRTQAPSPRRPVDGPTARWGAATSWTPRHAVIPCLLATAATCGLGCFLLPPADYPRCKRPPEAADIDAAQGAHGAAKRLYETKRYERAIDTWIAAYELDCTAHGVLINIARAHEKLGDEDEQLRALETYVGRAGKDADMDIVAEVEALKAKQGAPPAASATAEPNPQVGPEVNRSTTPTVSATPASAPPDAGAAAP